MSKTWTVYHGGEHYGLGRWSGPHASWAEADASRTACEQVVGGAPFVEADEDDGAGGASAEGGAA